MTNANILIIGTGAIGGFYGGKLSQAGAKVSTVCRSDFETVLSDGIKVKSILGDFTYKPHKVVKKATDFDEKLDYVIVATKVLPNIDVIPDIKKVISKDTAIVLLQNGINIEKPYIEAFPENEIISGLAFICSSKIGAGSIDHQDFGRLVIGKFPNGNSDKTQLLGKLFNESSIECEVTDDASKARWVKLIWNAPFNPFSVIGGEINTAEMVNGNDNENLVRSIMKEVIDLANVNGVDLAPELVNINIAYTKSMKPYEPSMLLDFKAKRPMEVEAILGNTVRIANEINFPIPHIETFYAILKLIDGKNLK